MQAFPLSIRKKTITRAFKVMYGWNQRLWEQGGTVDPHILHWGHRDISLFTYLYIPSHCDFFF